MCVWGGGGGGGGGLKFVTDSIMIVRVKYCVCFYALRLSQQFFSNVDLST